jgi:hypothetical protein
MQEQIGMVLRYSRRDCRAVVECLGLSKDYGPLVMKKAPHQRVAKRALLFRDKDARPRVLMIMGLAASLESWKPQVLDLMQPLVRSSCSLLPKTITVIYAILIVFISFHMIPTRGVARTFDIKYSMCCGNIC